MNKKTDPSENLSPNRAAAIPLVSTGLTVLWLAAIIILSLNSYWLVALGFFATGVLDYLPGRAKFLADVAFIALCLYTISIGFTVLGLAVLLGGYLLLFCHEKLLYDNWFYQQLAYMNGLSSKEYYKSLITTNKE